MLLESFEAEIANFLSHYRDLKDSDGRQRTTGNGPISNREIQTEDRTKH